MCTDQIMFLYTNYTPYAASLLPADYAPIYLSPTYPNPDPDPTPDPAPVPSPHPSTSSSPPVTLLWSSTRSNPGTWNNTRY